MSERVLVVTYGSLRTGMQNFRVNERAGGVSIGEGFTEQPALLSRYGGAYFPVVSLDPEHAKGKIRVEVFETTQDGLEGPYDSLEGYPNFYNRTKIPVILDSGETVEGWIYHIDDLGCHGETVESCDWKNFHLNNGRE